MPLEKKNMMTAKANKCNGNRKITTMETVDYILQTYVYTTLLLVESSHMIATKILICLAATMKTSPPGSWKGFCSPRLQLSLE